jgi:hypothetical protein
LSYSKAIRTFTEQEIEKDVLRSIRDEVSSAERIVFLGFGYHAQNIKLLTPRQNTSPKHIIGTARGLANSAKLSVQERLRSDFASALVANSVELFDMDCGELLEEHRLSFIA